jgi:hypothetical protein
MKCIQEKRLQEFRNQLQMKWTNDRENPLKTSEGEKVEVDENPMPTEET